MTKKRFLEKYKNHKINKNYIPETIIINLTELNINPYINTEKYKQLYSNNTFQLFKLK